MNERQIQTLINTDLSRWEYEVWEHDVLEEVLKPISEPGKYL